MFAENHRWCPAVDCLETAHRLEVGRSAENLVEGFDRFVDLVPNSVAHPGKMVVPLAVARYWSPGFVRTAIAPAAQRVAAPMAVVRQFESARFDNSAGLAPTVQQRLVGLVVDAACHVAVAADRAAPMHGADRSGAAAAD